MVSKVSFSCFSRFWWFLKYHSHVFHAFADFYGLDLMFSRVCWFYGLDLMFSRVCWFLVSRVFYAFVGFLVLFSCLSCPNQPNYQRGLTSKQGSPKIHDMNIYTISTLVYIFICIKILSLSLNIYIYIIIFSAGGHSYIGSFSTKLPLANSQNDKNNNNISASKKYICRIFKKKI